MIKNEKNNNINIENNITKLGIINNNKTFKNKNHEYSKEELQDIPFLKTYIDENFPNLNKHLENFEYLDSGTHSNVYRVNLKKNKNYRIIMKLILKKKRKNKIMQEILISNKLKNINIINFYKYIPIKNDNSDCIFMEDGKYGNLRFFQDNIIKNNILSETILCFFSFQILKGLNYLYKCKIAHFDLKPQNIIIDSYLNIKIIDFSESVDYSKIKSDKIKLPFCGTNFYIAPEVIKSKEINLKDINKVDLYSLGVILYRLAFGYYPYSLNREDDDNYEVIYDKVTKNNLEFDGIDKSFYSNHFIEFVKKLLEKDINKRINITQALDNYWIKGAKILNDEKEKLYNINSFLIGLITDNISNFNKYLGK